MLKGRILFLACLLAGACGSFAHAESMDVQAELRELKAQVAELRAQASDSWMSRRRAEEVKALIGEVLADADTRASMAGDGVTAGWDNNFFLASEDGRFLLILNGEFQTRYIFNSLEDDDDTTDDNVGGFQQKRTRLSFKGHLYDPRLEYKIRGGFGSSGDSFNLEVGFAKYHVTDDFYVRAGQFKGRFLREEQIGPFKQMAVERSNVNEFFTLDYTRGVEVGGDGAAFNWSALLYGGRENDRVDWDVDGIEYAAAGRAEVLLAGSMDQFKSELIGWSGSEFGLMLGAGVDYEKMEVGTSTNTIDRFWQWTADVNVQLYPFSFFAAVVGREIDQVSGDDPSQLGVVAQGNVFLVPDKWDVFVRYEWIDHDGVGEALRGSSSPYDFGYSPSVIASDREDEIDIWTFGTNYYLHGHQSKATVDFVWAPDGVIRGEPGSGVIGRSGAGENDDQYVVRAQYQLVF
jgi:hypothetical protein